MRCDAPFKERFNDSVRRKIAVLEYNVRFQHPKEERARQIEGRIKELRGLLV